MKKGITVWLVFLLLFPLPAWSALPLLTDDTGTQGKGKFQLEIGGELDRDRESTQDVTVKETDYFLISTLTYGVTEKIDAFVAVPYVWSIVQTGEGASTDRVNGVADSVVGVKLRFFEEKSLSLAIKPFVSVPTGNFQKDLGTGKLDYGAVLIFTNESGPWSFHANLGYARNENKIEERNDWWLLSGAVIFEVVKDVKLCADIGAATNRDKTSEVEPAYLLGGVIYAVSENLEFSFGVKKALSQPETDWAFLPGVTWRF